MELDVHLKRAGEESWGFRLIGGKDFNMPLTVVKVLPNSPADKAGLQNGDAVCRINDVDTTDLSHDSAKKAVDATAEALVLAVKRGLYDPVLDDFEPLYEPIDQDDFDQPSQPTEVDPFSIQQFTDQNNLAPLPELRDIETPFKSSLERDIGTPYTDATELQSRSMTASPFVLPTKPYRPFSTEPLPIPPLEDPIILNPEYSDQFGKLDDDEEIKVETKFKLPISEQYDPDGSKRKKLWGKTSKEIVAESSVKKDLTFEERVIKETKISEELQHKMIVDEVKFMEKMKKDIDLNKIEMTATSLVDESIERAVSVADEIKKEIAVELSESKISSEVKQSTVVNAQSESTKEAIVTSKVSNEKSSKETTELVDLIDKTTEEIISYNGSQTEVCVAKAVEKFKKLESKQQNTTETERKLSTQKEIEETIVSGSVRRKSEAFDKSAEDKSVAVEQSVKKSSDVQVKNKATTEKYVDEKAVKSESSNRTAKKDSEIKKESTTTTQKTASKTDFKTTKQRAYTIGLQTIPNIKGTIHSSYHYNLLLKTFFIHLTDVMVALSRFILTEPVFDKEATEEKEVVTTTETTTEHIDVTDDNSTETLVQESKVEYKKLAKDEQLMQKEEEKQEEQKVAVEKMVAENQEISTETKVKKEDLKVIEYGKAEDVKEYLELEEAIETRMLSGAKMAQLTERKSEELTQRMDAVITEFETKAGIEASTELRERRSRSRSRIEEEVVKESDPLELLSKVDKQTQEVTEVKTESKAFSSSYESEAKNKTTFEKRESKTSKSKQGKQMYVAIVESHVFTNQDAIFEEQFSETSSVQSVDEVNVALKASETIATEKVAIEKKDIKQEIAETVLEKAQELAIVNACSEAVQMQQNEKVQEVKAIESETESLVQEIAVQEIVEPVIRTQEIKTTTVSEDIKKVDIKEQEHSTLVSEKTEYIVEEAEHEFVHEKKAKQTVSITEVENLESIVEAVKEEVKEAVVEKPVEIISTEISVVKPAKVTHTKDEASAGLKIIKEEILEVDQTLQLSEEAEYSVNEHTEIVETENQFTVSQTSAVQNLTESQFIVSQKSAMESYESTEVVQESSFTARRSEQSKEVVQESSFTARSSEQSKEVVQESSFTARASEQSKKLTLQLDLAEQRRSQSQSSLTSDPPSTIDTPTPATVPPTPLTDEYVFKLHIPLPKNTGDPIPRDCTPTPEDEDPHIVKKKLIPHIETTIDSPIIYDPPLPTPPADKVQSPVYTKPGLRGGSDRREFRRTGGKKKEEILEIERRSTLLASAIDETIKCIEEYKEEVGIETKKEVKVEETTTMQKSSTVVAEHKTLNEESLIENGPIVYNGYAKVETKVYDEFKNGNSKISEESSHVDEQIKDTNDKLNNLSCTLNGDATELKTEAKESIDAPKITDSVLEESNTIMESGKTNGVLVNGDNTEVPKSISVPIGDLTSAKDSAVAVEFPVTVFKVEEKKRDPLEGYRPIQFNPEELRATKKSLQSVHLSAQQPMQRATSPGYVGPTGELLGTHQGIVDGLEEAVVDSEVAKELGKPGMTEEKIAELISGESEMLREAHVMGLSRVLKSHMHRADDDSSVDFKKIKPIIDSLKDSEVLKALNDELIKTQEEKKKEEQKKWTTFLQKPARPVPKAKFGYHGWTEELEKVEEPYKVKIVKQPKPKVAPDYKPENFETGPLPWEERALNEPPPPPVSAEDPILIPEEVPEFLEAVDPLPESEVPDLEETGIPLPPPKTEEEVQPSPVPETEDIEEQEEDQPEVLDIDAVVEETERIVEEMEQNRLAEQLLSGVQSMVDPNATVDQQLAQMRAQLAALAQLPNVIQQTLDLVTRQLSQLTNQETQQVSVTQTESHAESVEETRESVEVTEVTEVQTNGITEISEEIKEETQIEEVINEAPTTEGVMKTCLTEEEMQKLKREEEEMLEEQRRIEKQKKEMEQLRLDQEARQVKQRPTPRVGKPKPVFGPPVPVDRPLVLPGGRKWRKPADAYNEQFIKDTLTAQAEIIQGKAMGINFMKYEKPPVSLDHLKESETYKLIHNMEATPPRRVEMLTPVIAEVDYREKCRSVTPAHMNMPQQVHP